MSCKEPFYSIATPAFTHLLLLQHPWSNASRNKAKTNQSKRGQKTNRPENEVNLKNLAKSQNCVEVKQYFTTRTRMRHWLENNKMCKTLMARLLVHWTGDAAVRNINILCFVAQKILDTDNLWFAAYFQSISGSSIEANPFGIPCLQWSLRNKKTEATLHFHMLGSVLFFCFFYSDHLRSR